MKPLLLTLASILLMGGVAMAQNTKGTEAEGKTTTTTNPLPPVVSSQSLDSRHHADLPAGTNRGNPAATEAAQPDAGHTAPSPHGAR